MMTGWGLEEEAYQDAALLEILPKLLHAQHANQYAADVIFVDGTSLVPSTFDVDENGDELPGNTAAADGGSLYIGTLGHALVLGGDTAVVGVALWPPIYVLETAALEDGLVIVNNVNCGYLDFATNFLTAARKVVSDVKVSRRSLEGPVCTRQNHLSASKMTHAVV